MACPIADRGGAAKRGRPARVSRPARAEGRTDILLQADREPREQLRVFKNAFSRALFLLSFRCESFEGRAWEKATFADEPVVRPHRRGSVNFARGGPDTRAVEIAITTNGAAALDTVRYLGVLGFPTIAKVEQGVDVLDRLNWQYGNAPIQNDSLSILGGGYLDRVLPGRDHILGARVRREWTGTSRRRTVTPPGRGSGPATPATP